MTEDLLAVKQAAVERRLSEAAIDEADVRVAVDPFGGWRLLVVADAFGTMSSQERRHAALGADHDESLQWFDLVTNSEYEPELTNRLMSQSEQLSLWPSALAADLRSHKPIVFLSDSDVADLEAPFVCTFFSLRGGVGRSTSLVSTSRLLASRGLRVLCIDMDLEAPGLAALFGREADVGEDQGTVALLTELDMSDQVDLASNLIRVSETKELYCLPAGLPSANYARRLSLLDPESWHDETDNPLRALFKSVSDSSIGFDVVLVDARTGISPLNAPLVFELSDLVVISFFPHQQSLRGTCALTHGLLSSQTWRGDRQYTPEPRFVITPVPPERGPDRENFWEQRGRDAIADWLLPANESRHPLYPQIDVDDITHVVAYNEAIANSESVLEDSISEITYGPIADWIEGFATKHPVETVPESRTLIDLEDKREALDSLSFSSGVAEVQDPAELKETYLRTDVVNQAMSQRVPLVLGRKGAGKSALFRMIQLSGDDVVIGLAPRGLNLEEAWLPNAEAFSAIDTDLRNAGEGWSTYWYFHIALAYARHISRRGERVPTAVDAPIARLIETPNLTPLGLVEAFRIALGQRDLGLRSADWLATLNRSASHHTTILFDGLDTEFGLSELQRNRRSEAVGQLLSVVDSLQSFKQLRFKVLLRDDIWRSVSLPNKSHFFGRALTLAWGDQIDYLKVVLKQALRQSAFRAYSLGRLREAEAALLKSEVPVDDWPEDATLSLWRVLVGQRLAGGNTAYTHNWVWNRLADGTGAHSPRSLLQLFRLAAARESDFIRRGSYLGSLIRPRALTDSLDEVSNEALEALREEFSELHPMLQMLRSVGKTPFDVAEFGSDRDHSLEQLAIEVGLLSAPIDDPREVERYRVPEIYRRALGMTRRGQV